MASRSEEFSSNHDASIRGTNEPHVRFGEMLLVQADEIRELKAMVRRKEEAQADLQRQLDEGEVSNLRFKMKDLIKSHCRREDILQRTIKEEQFEREALEAKLKAQREMFEGQLHGAEEAHRRAMESCHQRAEEIALETQAEVAGLRTEARDWKTRADARLKHKNALSAELEQLQQKNKTQRKKLKPARAQRSKAKKQRDSLSPRRKAPSPTVRSSWDQDREQMLVSLRDQVEHLRLEMSENESVRDEMKGQLEVKEKLASRVKELVSECAAYTMANVELEMRMEQVLEQHDQELINHVASLQAEHEYTIDSLRAQHERHLAKELGQQRNDHERLLTQQAAKHRTDSEWLLAQLRTEYASQTARQRAELKAQTIDLRNQVTQLEGRIEDHARREQGTASHREAVHARALVQLNAEHQLELTSHEQKTSRLTRLADERAAQLEACIAQRDQHQGQVEQLRSTIAHMAAENAARLALPREACLPDSAQTQAQQTLSKQKHQDQRTRSLTLVRREQRAVLCLRQHNKELENELKTQTARRDKQRQQWLDEKEQLTEEVRQFCAQATRHKQEASALRADAGSLRKQLQELRFRAQAGTTFDARAEGEAPGSTRAELMAEVHQLRQANQRQLQAMSDMRQTVVALLAKLPPRHPQHNATDIRSSPLSIIG